MIFVRVQAHPSREHLLPNLLEALEPLPVEILQHSSDPPDPWAGYKRCLSNLPECSHIAILQDDALPCANFPAAVERVAARHPSTPVCLFLGGAPSSTAAQARRAWNKGRRYTPLLNTTFVPLVAVLWPRDVAQRFLEWSRTARTTRADDGNAARFMRVTKQPFMVTVPSLVEHNDFTPSVKGGRVHAYGKESWRQAVLLAQDGADYEW